MAEPRTDRTSGGRGTTEGLRRANTALVLRSLRDGGPATRVELAARTGLSKATVGVIVAALEESGALGEGPAPEPGAGPTRGRPGRPLTLAGEDHVGLGFELNVDYVAACVVDLAGHERLRTTRPVPRGEDGLAQLGRLAAEVAQTLAGPRSTEGARVVGATVAVPGLVRSDERTLAWTPNLSVGGDEPARTVERALGGRIETRAGNDADCAGRAEARHGAARGVAHALYITGTVGIGAGILEDGRPLRGGAGFAGEVGHLPLAGEDAVCGCGRRGCWEAAVGLGAMLAAVGMEELDTPTASAEAVVRRAVDDEQVRAGLERLGASLGRGLAVLTTVLDPEVIVLGGYFAVLGETVLAPARAALDAQLAAPVQVRPELRPGALGITAAALGAAERSLEPLFRGEVSLDAVPRHRA